MSDVPKKLRNALEEEKEQTMERAARLDKAQHGEETAGGDKQLPTGFKQDFTSEADSARKHFSDKLYFFPESYNALRRELHENWPTLFNVVNPETGTSLAYDMAFNAAQFIGTLNGALDMVEQMDSDDVSGICQRFLDALRVKRGLTRLN